MKLIERMEGNKVSKGGKIYSIAKFFCDFCKREVIKGFSEGKFYKSCGCYRPAGIKCHLYKHGLTGSPLHKLWRSMNRRCNSKGGDQDYIKKGIIVCDEWKNDFLKFYNWALPLYKPALQIDRIDNNGNYEPRNCRFVTPLMNNLNSKRPIRNRLLLPAVQKAIDEGWTNNRIHKIVGMSSSTICRYLIRGQLKNNKRFRAPETVKRKRRFWKKRS